MPACGSPASGRLSGAPRRAALVVVLSVAAMLLPEVAVPSAVAGPSDAELRERQDRLEAERGELESGLEQTEAERDRLAERLSSATERVERLRGRLAELEDKAAHLSGEIEDLEQRAASSQERMGERVTELYKRAGQSEVAGLLSGESPADLAGRSHYLVALSRNDREAFEVAAADSMRLARRREELAETTDEVAEVTERARLAQQELESRLAEAAAAAEQTRGRLARVEAAGSEVAEQLEHRARAARAEAASQEAAAGVDAAATDADAGGGDGGAGADTGQPEVSADADAGGAEASADTGSGGADVSAGADGAASDSPSSGGAASNAGGGMACPQDRPRSYSDTWGAPRSGGRSHEGTDIFGQMGGDVFAITDGVIEWTRRGSSAGLWLSLRSDDGDRYWYMHLSGFVASAGQRVSAGQHIANNGNTGNARGGSPHIHFEYHPGGGRPVNPYSLVRRVCG